ncbi:ribonuclease D [Pleionea sediminis]|uniref:ribonuclease D n=1 Tax=Pleionea sediminis TaxID=2569479 RepID=UPI001185CFB8|nr:HRDC domain-containing protein [Pleionea sediminis]
MVPSFQWLTTSESLKPAVERWLSCSELFIDTEFIREKTFYPELALIQVFDGEQCYLIEPRAADDDSKFCEILTSSSIRKVFHSASEDCEVLFRHFNVQINHLWDTQVVAAFLGHGLSIGYSRLIEHYCQCVLDKGLSRSDWQKRPLSEEQIRYALEDVTYLAEAYNKQKQELDDKSFDIQWILEECESLAQRIHELDEIELAYLDIKNAWKLNKKQLVRLQQLAQWRESTAREKNRPKTFVCRNEVLFSLAQKGCKDSHLPEVKGWHPASRRKYQAAILKLLQEIEEADVKDIKLIQPLSPSFWQQQTHNMQLARELIDKKANELGIDPDVLCSKKLLRNYVKFCLGKRSTPPRGWTSLRESSMGESIKAIFVTG